MDCIKKIRIIFGVPEGGSFSTEFASVAAEMPEAECLFLGFSWSAGFDVRKSKFKFKHSPLNHIGIHRPHTIPHFADFVSRGYSHKSIPDSAKRTFATVRAFVECEIERFTPDAVITGPIDNVICHVLDEIAKERGIPIINIQTCFMANNYIVHSQGAGWIDYLKNHQILAPTSRCSAYSVPNLRSISDSSAFWKTRIFIRGFERLFRFLYGGVTFDTFETFASRLSCKISPNMWFPTVQTLESLEDTQADYVLVVLNQPALTSCDSPTWIDLLTLALAATPEDVPIIVRPHPSEPAKDLPIELENALRLRCSFISRVGVGPDLSSIIKHCRAVLTLNSAVGMEALLDGKLVFTFSPAFYARPGMAHAVTTADVALICEMLSSHGHHQPDSVKVKEFLEWLLAESVIPAHLVSGTGNAKNPLAGFIADMVKQRGTAD